MAGAGFWDGFVGSIGAGEVVENKLAIIDSIPRIHTLLIYFGSNSICKPVGRARGGISG